MYLNKKNVQLNTNILEFKLKSTNLYQICTFKFNKFSKKKFDK